MEPKPCPCECGRNPQTKRSWDESDRFQTNHCRIACVYCGRETKIYENRDTAIQAWNNDEYDTFFHYKEKWNEY